MLTRRTLFSAGLSALGIGAVGVGGLSGCANQAGGPTADTSFTHKFTGYDGRELTLPRFPERIVCDGYSFAAMWPYGIRPVGLWGYSLDDREELGGADPAGIEVVGRELELSVESLASLKPDLLVGFGNKDGTSWQWWDEPLQNQVRQVAPYAGIQFGQRDVAEIIEDYRSLARALRGTADDPSVQQAETAYRDALQRIRELTASKKLTVLPISVGNPSHYVGTTNLAQLRLLAEHGVAFKEYPVESATSAWSQVSSENLAGDDSDLVMVMTVTSPITEDATLVKLPAVVAEQITGWDDKRPNHYANYAQWLNQFADAYEAAKPV